MKRGILSNLLMLAKASNPFLLVDREGEVAKFKDATEAYGQVLWYMLMEFKEGYIDLPLFMATYQGVPINDAERICGRNMDVFLFEFTNVDCGGRREKLRNIFGKLLEYSECEFDEMAFNDALAGFDSMLCKEDVYYHITQGDFQTILSNLLEYGYKTN